MYIIIEWCSAYDAAILTDEFGENLTFVDSRNAERYAKKNCAWHYRVIST